MMKKIIWILIPVLAFSINTGAQTLLDKVPDNASFVLKYSGDNFSKLVPVQKLDSYAFIKDDLYKALKMDTLTSLASTGIDFGQDIYQYVSMEDSSMNFISLFHLQNSSQFVKMLDAGYAAEMKPQKMNGFEFLTVSDNSYIGWNNTEAVLVISSYQNPNRYRYFDPEVDSVTAILVDTALVQAPVEDKFEPYKDTLMARPKQPAARNKPVAKAKPGQKSTAKKAPAKKKPGTIKNKEEITADSTFAVTQKYYYQDSLQQARREAWEKTQEKITAARQKLIAGDIINTAFNGTVKSIKLDESYKKIIDPAANVTAWINSGNLIGQYWMAAFNGFNHYPMYGSNYVSHKNSDGFRSAVNIYFEKDKMRMEQKSYSPDEQMAKLGKDLFNSKQNPALVNYINPDHIGYLSMSINSEAMARYYYKLMRQWLDDYSYTAEYADLVDVYIDFLEIMIDEKALSELAPGNYLFVVHGMKTKKVSYTDYDYDDNFQQKQTIKTKDELSPDFTFVMETRREDFMQKLVKLPLKYAKKEHYNYQDRGGYYELVFDTGKYPLNSLYFMVKNGQAMITTSKASIDLALNGKAYPPDNETKNSVLENNYSMKINSKRLLQQINPELTTAVNKKICDYLQENVGDIKMESRLKDGMMQGTTIMNIRGNHANSLEYFFNLVEGINNIIQKDKEENDKKIN